METLGQFHVVTLSTNALTLKFFVKVSRLFYLNLLVTDKCAFIRGRQLMHNITVHQETVTGYKRYNLSPKCIMKVDLSTKYNSVNKGISGEVIKCFHFLDVFRNSIIINGGSHSLSLKSGTRLRQGSLYQHYSLC